MTSTFRFVTVGLLGVVVFSSLLLGQEKKPPKRVKRPTFTPRDIDGVYFKDLFKEGLIGARPDRLGQAIAVQPRGGGDTNQPDTSNGGTGGFAWSKVISSEAIEDEVKKLGGLVDRGITTPNRFASGGFEKARQNFTLLAMLFGIISEYDGEVRWKKFAPQARDLFSRSASNATVGDIRMYNQAKLRKQDLQDILSGSFSAEVKSEPAPDWSSVCDRPPLMDRLEIAHQERIKPWTASESDFKAHAEELAHEANIVAAMAEVLAKEGMPDGDSDDYTVHAKLLKQGAHEIIEAVKLKQYDMAARGESNIAKSCSDCHADWQ